MTQFHPDSQWLTEYIAGTLSDAQALCVSSHLRLCDHCRSETAQLVSLGAAVFENQTPCAINDDELFEHMMRKIESNPAATTSEQDPLESASLDHKLPAAIRKLAPDGIDNLRWQKLGKYIRVAKLQKLDAQREVALHKLLPGGAVAEHDHHGREITVVLCGSFSDQDGVYTAGDFLVREPGQTHRPTVTNDEECICLSVTDAPVKFTGKLSRLLNPLVAYQHRH